MLAWRYRLVGSTCDPTASRGSSPLVLAFPVVHTGQPGGRDGCPGRGQGSRLPRDAIEPMLDDVPQHVPFGRVSVYTAIGYGLWYARSSALIQGDVFLMSCDS